jgi:hypothetical protein
MKRFVFVIGLAMYLFSAEAQHRLVQFSGIIYHADSAKRVVPYVTILNKSRNQTFPGSYQGYFSFVAHERDTIVFSAVGYGTEAVVIPSDLPEMKYSIALKMKPQSITLPAVQIYPWATVDEFTRAFLSLKLADDNLLVAKKNLSNASIMAMAQSLPRDAQEQSQINFSNNHYALSNKNFNQRASNPLLNPFAWAAFIQQIAEGDKSRASGD